MTYLLGTFFLIAGLFHFLKPASYLQIMPPYLPHPLLLVYFSGLAEIGLGILVMIPKTRRLAGWGLILLLIAVFPANIQMALHPEIFPEVPTWMSWVRLPIQFVLIFWVWRVSRR